MYLDKNFLMKDNKNIFFLIYTNHEFKFIIINNFFRKK